MRTIGARKTTARLVPLEEALEFTKLYHRQGLATPGKNIRAWGLYAEEELLAVAFFCNPRTRRKQAEYTTELFRLTFKNSVRIPGGASKLIKRFMATGPWDIFTYQDTAGEASDLYERAGLKLVGDEKVTKSILVKDGLTAATAENNRKDWFSLEQAVSHGPDQLIGTELGSLFDESGKRISNIRLFVEYCGYHLEEIPGDRLYEWRNPEVFFYTYKITAPGDDGYYFGRHLFRGREFSEENALADGYWGGGGRKFQDWMNFVGKANLQKEILGVYSSWKAVIKAEEKLIGDLNYSDPNCKNHQPGGTGMTRPTVGISLKLCPTHGESKHRGDSCGKCESSKVFKIEECSTHGAVIHRKGKCTFCASRRSVSLRECSTHGLTKHQGDNCARCRNEALISMKECPIHGLVKHRSNTCLSCSVNRSISLRTCLTHGPTNHMGNTCLKCNQRGRYSVKECSIHGKSNHRGGACLKCATEKTVSMKLCPTHGETKFLGDSCASCAIEKGNGQKVCPTHGLTFHRGETCMKCSSSRHLGRGICPTHGETTFRGNSCARCISASAKKTPSRECKIHGLTKFNGDSCAKCVAENQVTLKECPVHGETKYSAGTCMKCRSKKLTAQKECPTHGLSYHRGNSCMKCSAAKRKKK